MAVFLSVNAYQRLKIQVMSREEYNQKLKELVNKQAENTRKINEIEFRVDKIVDICKEASFRIPDEVLGSVIKAVEEARAKPANHEK